IFCVRFCKWFRARREALLLAMETRRIKRSRSRSHSISHKSSTEKPPKKDEDKFKKEDDNIAGKSLETAESRPELSIDIESKTTNGPPQIISGVHITESKSDKGDSLSLDVEFRPTKASEKSIGGNIQMFGSMRDNGGGGTFSGSGSLGE
uniref:KMT2A n=1 Tax=Meloidogyne hapla TaxID=6305 RepID=A0A1I8BIK6_MELHA